MVYWTEGRKLRLSKQKFFNQQNSLICVFTIVIVCFMALSWISGCAPLPPLDEGAIAEKPEVTSGSDLAKAERDSLIKVRRSFAYERWKNKDWDNAREHFSVIALHDTEHKENIYRTWADCFVNNNMQDSALWVYEEGVKYFPEDAYLRSSLAIMYKNSGRLDDALVQQLAAVKVEPEREEYLVALSELYEKLEDWGNAREIYSKLVSLFPDNSMYSQRQADIIKMYFDPEEYLKVMKEGVEQFPDDPKRRLAYASVLSDQGYYENAAAEYQTYSLMMPDDTRGWRGLAQMKDNLSDYNGAITARKKVVELEPESLDDIVAVGGYYLGLKSWTQARSWAQKALAKDGNCGAAWVLMGDIYFNAADKASGDSPKFNDKLVFVIAYGLYQKAVNSNDAEARSNGDRGMRILKGGGLVPTNEERFMNKTKTKPSGDAYSWIDSGYPEVNYISSYLKSLE
jgi:tetratricopeptide (TPR) repeat protein